ncbi:MAG: hypothetical protein ACTINB_19920 [Serratia liquefaciens]|jgi:hypothetical protein
MRKYTMDDMADKFRSLSTLLAASLVLDDTDDGERELAFILVDMAAVKAKKLAQELEKAEVHNA